MKRTAKKILDDANLHNTYWGRKIIAAESRGFFTKSNEKQASCWQTYACGKQDRRIPRARYLGAPLDNKLANLGADFSCYVDCDKEHSDPVRAARLLIAIEKRAAIVLRKELRRANRGVWRAA